MHVPVCGKCFIEMKCKKNGLSIRLDGGYIVYGDLYECPHCGCRIVTGFGEPFKADYEVDHELNSIRPYPRRPDWSGDDDEITRDEDDRMYPRGREEDYIQSSLRRNHVDP